MEEIESIVSLVSKMILLFIVIMVVFITAAYFVYRIRVIKADTNKQRKYQEFLQNELKKWASHYEVKKIAKDDMFSSRRMTNGEVGLKGLEIQIKDYTNSVPWFIKVR